MCVQAEQLGRRWESGRHANNPLSYEFLTPGIYIGLLAWQIICVGNAVHESMDTYHPSAFCWEHRGDLASHGLRNHDATAKWAAQAAVMPKQATLGYTGKQGPLQL